MEVTEEELQKFYEAFNLQKQELTSLDDMGQIISRVNNIQTKEIEKMRHEREREQQLELTMRSEITILQSQVQQMESKYGGKEQDQDFKNLSTLLKEGVKENLNLLNQCNFQVKEHAERVLITQEKQLQEKESEIQLLIDDLENAQQIILIMQKFKCRQELEFYKQTFGFELIEISGTNGQEYSILKNEKVLIKSIKLHQLDGQRLTGDALKRVLEMNVSSKLEQYRINFLEEFTKNESQQK